MSEGAAKTGRSPVFAAETGCVDPGTGSTVLNSRVYIDFLPRPVSQDDNPSQGCSLSGRL